MIFGVLIWKIDPKTPNLQMRIDSVVFRRLDRLNRLERQKLTQVTYLKSKFEDLFFCFVLQRKTGSASKSKIPLVRVNKSMVHDTNISAEHTLWVCGIYLHLRFILKSDFYWQKRIFIILTFLEKFYFLVKNGFFLHFLVFLKILKNFDFWSKMGFLKLLKIFQNFRFLVWWSPKIFFSKNPKNT